MHPAIAAALQDGGNLTKGQLETNTTDQQGKDDVTVLLFGHMAYGISRKATMIIGLGGEEETQGLSVTGAAPWHEKWETAYSNSDL